ncbi:MAG: hypothetical protein JWQ04_2840 [Pedosphaera sp.]|nr:hypothetical protein [Pedosphaera sp.]
MKVQWNKLIVGGLHLAAGALIKHGWVHASVIHWAGGIVAAAIGYVAHNLPPDEIKEDAAPLLSRALKMLLCLALPALLLLGCHTPSFQAGGAYSGSTVATNATGLVTTNVVSAPDPAFYLADSGYKLAYQTVDGVLGYELQYRAQLKISFPQLKPALDAIRPTLWNIDQRWAAARLAYQKNPTPAGLTILQSILPEIQRLVPTVQAAIAPVYAAPIPTPAPVPAK